MKLKTPLSLISAASLPSSSDFHITSLTTHQPNSNPGGQINVYNIEFNLSSTISGVPASSYYVTSWPDNQGHFYKPNCAPYSTYVPTDRWLSCSVAPRSSIASQFEFHLFPYFSVGNFSVQVRQNYTGDGASSGGNLTTVSDVFQITNYTLPTSIFACDINPQEIPDQNHASGDCYTPEDSSGIFIHESEA